MATSRSAPIAEAAVSAWWIGKTDLPRLIGRTVSSEDGAYRLILDERPRGEGALLLRADAGGYASDGRYVELGVGEQSFALSRDSMSIEVHVVDPLGADVAGAEVFVSFEPRAGRAGTLLVESASTDARGRFTMRAVPPSAGTVHYSAIARGRGRAFGSIAKPHGDADLKIEARLAAGETLSGVVAGTDGQPIAGVHLEVEETNGPWAAGTDSRDEGRFAIEDAPKDAGLLLAIDGDWVLAGGNDTLEIGEQRGALRVVVEPAGKIRGRVVTPEGEPIAGAAISALPSDRTIGAPRASTSAEDGSFELRGLRRGTTWELEARHPERAPAFLEGASADHETELVMRAGGVIEGSVYDGTGRGYEDIEVYVHRTAIAGDRIVGLREYAETRTDKDGKYRLERLGEGSWRVELRSRVRMQWAPIAAKVIETTVTDGRTTTLSAVELPRGGTLRGVLSDGDGPIAVSLLPHDQLGAPHSLRVGTGPGGIFEVPELQPGEYAVHVRHPALGFATIPKIRIVAGETTAVELVFKGTHRVAGVVARSDGSPVEGALVEVYAADAGSQSTHPLPGRAPDNFTGGSTRTGAGGAFTVTGLEARGYRLRIEKENLPPHEIDLVAGTGNRVYEIELPAPAALTVRLERGEAAVLVESERYSATALADEHGTAHFAALSPGTYRVRAAAPGLPETTVDVRAGAASTIDLPAKE